MFSRLFFFCYFSVLGDAVCIHLKMCTGANFASFGKGTSPIQLTELRCTGSEENLLLWPLLPILWTLESSATLCSYTVSQAIIPITRHVILQHHYSSFETTHLCMVDLGGLCVKFTLPCCSVVCSGRYPIGWRHISPR